MNQADVAKILEFVAAVFGFFAVGLTIGRSVWCWPVGLVQVLLYVIVFYWARLYSDMGLHIAFAGLQVYGFVQWVRQRSNSAPSESGISTKVNVVSLSGRGRLNSLLLCGALTGLIGWGMSTWTDAALPWSDAFIAACSVVAQWQLAHRYLQNWYLWIVVDIVAIPVFASRDLMFTVVLYILFLMMSVAGAISWNRRYAIQRANIQHLTEDYA